MNCYLSGYLLTCRSLEILTPYGLTKLSIVECAVACNETAVLHVTNVR